MSLLEHITRQIRELYFGKSWTASCFKEVLEDISLEEAMQEIDSLNTIAGLVYHANYYVRAFLMVARGDKLDAADKYSFDLPELKTEADWQALVNETWTDVEELIQRLEQMPEEKLWEDFWEHKYGDYYRNIQGIIEHSYYHLGQIVILKKLVRGQAG